MGKKKKKFLKVIAQVTSKQHKTKLQIYIQKFLGNRPKMFPGFIGDHCIIPNLQLIDEHSLDSINKINNMFKKFLRNS